MTTFEEMQDFWPQTNVSNARGEGWVKAHPIPDWRWRVLLRDAWEVFRGRAVAVRQSTAADMAAQYQRNTAIRDARIQNARNTVSTPYEP